MPKEPYQEYSFSRSTKNIEVYTIESRDKHARKGGKNNLRLSLIDTVGYGDSMEMGSWQKHISSYIEGSVRFLKV
jgi:septin family protein